MYVMCELNSRYQFEVKIIYIIIFIFLKAIGKKRLWSQRHHIVWYKITNDSVTMVFCVFFFLKIHHVWTKHYNNKYVVFYRFSSL